jgi:transcriptional regulator with XRE-family HTH domain
VSLQKEAGISDRELCKEARLSSRTLKALRRNRKVEDAALFALAAAMERLRTKRLMLAADDAEAFAMLKAKRAELGSDAALAEFLGVSRSYVTRLLSGERQLTAPLRAKLAK